MLHCIINKIAIWHSTTHTKSYLESLHMKNLLIALALVSLSFSLPYAIGAGFESALKQPQRLSSTVDPSNIAWF